MGANLDSGSSYSSGPIADINVTPFIDVMLVLLVIFMVTAPAMMKDLIGINLPSALTSEKKTVDSIGLAVTRSGQFLIEGKLVSDQEITRQVQSLVAQNPKAQAVIAADQEVAHKHVVRAIDLIKSSGMNRFALQVSSDKSSSK